MREMHIALGVMQQGDEYLLQHRNGEVRIGAAGLIGCFGGKVNPDELPHLAVVREIGEETTLVSDDSVWQLVGEVYVESDHQLEPVKVRATVFYLNIDADINVEAKEGNLMRLKLEDIQGRPHELTPATKALFEKFYTKERN